MLALWREPHDGLARLRGLHLDHPVPSIEAGSRISTFKQQYASVTQLNAKATLFRRIVKSVK